MAVGFDFVWILFLNDMRMAHSEDTRPVARADSPEELTALMAKEKVEPYSEPTSLPSTSLEIESSPWSYRVNPQQWVKCFKKGGPLEWFNPPLGDNCMVRVARILDRSDEIDRIVEAKIFL